MGKKKFCKAPYRFAEGKLLRKKYAVVFFTALHIFFMKPVEITGVEGKRLRGLVADIFIMAGDGAYIASSGGACNDFDVAGCQVEQHQPEKIAAARSWEQVISIAG